MTYAQKSIGLFYVLLFSTLLNANIAGTTKGEFSVNQGTANYNLKIDVPPGVAGMEPQLSLNYNSNGGNGSMGVGWSMGGVSVITRCPQTKAVDGPNHKSGVNYDENDRFCLDGQRLIAVSGVYGRDNTEYKTEIDNYSRIIQDGVLSSGNGPLRFTVKTKNGLLYRYGLSENTDSSAYITRNGRKIYWSVSEIVDTYNNKISYHYKTNMTTGENYLESITYADNKVKFKYEGRPDQTLAYIGGKPLNMTVRLKEIVITTGSEEVRRYKIVYVNESAGTRRSKLVSIVEHVSEGDLKKLIFSWTNSDKLSFFNNGISLPDTYFTSSTGTDMGTRLADINGDGLTDIIQIYLPTNGQYGNKPQKRVFLKNGNSYVYNSTYSNSISSTYFTRSTGQDMGTRLADINGDGLVDIIQLYFPTNGDYGNHPQRRIFLNNGKSFVRNTAYSNSLSDTYFANSKGEDMGTRLADINGDGLTDIIQIYLPPVGQYGGIPQRRIFLNNGKGFVRNTAYSKSLGSTNFAKGGGKDMGTRLADINGDGLVDIVQLYFSGVGEYGGNPQRRIFLNTGKKFVYDGSSSRSLGDTYFVNSQGEDMGTRLADINGDGLTDIIQIYLPPVGQYGGIPQRRIFLNNGKGFVRNTAYSKSLGSTNFAKGGGKDMGTRLADINGDGLVDIVQLYFSGVGEYGGNPQRRIFLNTGKKFVYDGSSSRSLGDTYFVNSQGEDMGTRLADINGDGVTDIIQIYLPPYGQYGGKPQKRVYFNLNKKPLISRITNKTDQDIKVSYKRMTDQAVYYNYSTHGERNTYNFNKISNNNIEVTLPQSLVYTVNSANGTHLKSGNSPTAGYNQVRYKYFGYVINKDRGPQGFHAISVYDDSTRMLSETFYKQTGMKAGTEDQKGFQFTGMPYMSYSGRAYGEDWGKWMSRTQITYKDASKRDNIHEPYTYSNVQSVYDPDSKKIIENIYHYNTVSKDGLGNIGKTVDRTQDLVNEKDFFKTTINEYHAEDRDNWHIGRLTKATVVHEQTDAPNIVRVSTFKYGGRGLLKEEIANAGTGLALKKSYEYDGHGNKVKETVSGFGIQQATTTFTYDAAGKFPIVITDAAGMTEKRTYNEKFGTLLSVTNADGLTTKWTYDGLGRKIREEHPDGTVSTWSHQWYEGGILNNRFVYSVFYKAPGIPELRTFYDSVGRVTNIHHLVFGGKSLTESLKYYNAKGELYQEALPHIKDEVVEGPALIETTYDKYGRVRKVTKPGPEGTVQTYRTRYNDFTRVITDSLKHEKEIVENAIGQTIHTTDAKGTAAAATVSFKYDAAGNLLSTTDAGGNVIRMQYDAAGNKVYMKDPDLGIWHYAYNAAGQVVQQWSGHAGVDGSVNVTENKYDILGRLIKTNTYNRVEYLKDENAYTYHSEIYTYADVSAAAGTRGKLIKVYADGSITKDDWNAETKTMTYDTLGRQVSSNTYVDGRGDYLITTTYDVLSRPKTITYPNGYKIINHYQDGILDFVKGSDGKVHYRIDELTAFGQVSAATFANGVKTKTEYDTMGFTGTIVSYTGSPLLGNVQRLDYTYNVLGNVRTRNDTSIEGKYINDTFTYDAMNRLVSRSTDSDVQGVYDDAKSYHYDKTGNMTFQTGVGSYKYENGKPHAVSSAGSRVYTYDAVGNMINRNGDTITYNALNKPTVLKNKNGKEVRFYYGAGGQRFMKVTAKKDTYYIGKAYEEQVEDNEEKQICYIAIGGKVIGTHTEVVNTYYAPGHKKYKEDLYNRYFHTDALGSITAITDDAGTVVERRSYEPFGKIRAMDYGLKNGEIIPANTAIETARAYTGHEQIAELSGLIHMNARVYDSDIGRFLSADTAIQAPYDSQAYNRYSYVRNNPWSLPTLRAIHGSAKHGRKQRTG